MPDFNSEEVSLEGLPYGDKDDHTEYNEGLKKAWKCCKSQSKSIEVIYNDDDQKVLAKVHFRTDPLVS